MGGIYNYLGEMWLYYSIYDENWVNHTWIKEYII